MGSTVISSATPPTPGYKWELLVLFWLANFLNQGDRQIFNAILPRIQEGLGATDTQMGLVATIFTLCFGVLVPVAGWLGDRASRKRIVCLSLLVFSAGTLLTGFAGGLISLIIFRSVATGAGESFYTPPALSLIGQHHRRTRSLAMSINQTSQYVGVVASSWLAALLAENYGWRATFLVFGGSGLILAAVLFWRLRDDPPAREEAAESADASVSSGSTPPATAVAGPAPSPLLLLHNPTALLLASAFACLAFVLNGFMTWMPTLLYTKFQLPLATAAFQAVFLHCLFAFIGVLIGGWWTDRRAVTHPVARLHTGALGLILGAPFVFLIGYAQSLPVVYVALAVFGVLRGVYDANIYAALYEVVPVRLRATATGGMICFAYVTGATAPLLLGTIKQHFGLDQGLMWIAPVYLFGGLLIGLAALFFFARDRDAAMALS